ncbi:RDD family protein [Mesorhizobium sp.]|uniref:RDD family protein n=1 Tax=Mesorhizobium sp. TaxID=1871066 RepID=UPI0012263995|nr:RDD family protein [Mesorhizobium sp.]TIO30411.1 MAG: RDD family protein [Mesorhizobium sp.]
MAEWHYVADGKPAGPVTADNIHEKFRDGTVERNTLVWTEGMPGWQPIHEVEDFSGLTKRSVPPPVPGSLPAVPDVPISTVEADAVPELEIDEQPASAKEGEQIELSNLRVSEPRIPWSRYFARTFDVSVLGTVLITSSLLISPYVSVPLSFTLYTADTRALMVFALPFVMVLNAIIITIFGNSMGKKIFGIHAINVQAHQRFTFVENVARELRVWGRGMALGIPILNFFTMIPAYKRVAGGRPTLYDEGIASVRPYADSTARRTFGFIITALVLIAVLASNTIEKQNMDRVSRPYVWINPKTSLSTTIPGGWESETLPGPTGTGVLYAFTNLKTGVVALLAVETSEQLTLVSYADALETSLSKTMNFDDDWSRYDLPDVWKRSATMKDGNHPAALFLRQVDSSFWRVVYVDQLSKNRDIDKPELTRALFASVGVR